MTVGATPRCPWRCGPGRTARPETQEAQHPSTAMALREPPRRSTPSARRPEHGHRLSEEVAPPLVVGVPTPSDAPSRRPGNSSATRRSVTASPRARGPARLRHGDVGRVGPERPSAVTPARLQGDADDVAGPARSATSSSARPAPGGCRHGARRPTSPTGSRRPDGPDGAPGRSVGGVDGSDPVATWPRGSPPRRIRHASRHARWCPEGRGEALGIAPARRRDARRKASMAQVTGSASGNQPATGRRRCPPPAPPSRDHHTRALSSAKPPSSRNQPGTARSWRAGPDADAGASAASSTWPRPRARSGRADRPRARGGPSRSSAGRRARRARPAASRSSRVTGAEPLPVAGGRQASGGSQRAPVGRWAPAGRRAVHDGVPRRTASAGLTPRTVCRVQLARVEVGGRGRLTRQLDHLDRLGEAGSPTLPTADATRRAGDRSAGRRAAAPRLGRRHRTAGTRG